MWVGDPPGPGLDNTALSAGTNRSPLYLSLWHMQGLSEMTEEQSASQKDVLPFQMYYQYIYCVCMLHIWTHFCTAFHGHVPQCFWTSTEGRFESVNRFVCYKIHRNFTYGLFFSPLVLLEYYRQHNVWIYWSPKRCCGTFQCCGVIEVFCMFLFCLFVFSPLPQPN